MATIAWSRNARGVDGVASTRSRRPCSGVSQFPSRTAIRRTPLFGLFSWSRANGARHELARRLVGGDDHAGVADAALHELPLGRTRARGEQSLASADGHGMRPDVHAVAE